MKLNEKQDLVTTLNQIFNKTQIGLLVDYRGLNVAEISDLRRKLHGSDTQMRGMVRGEETRRWQAVYSIRRRGYWPSAALVAMLLATPMSHRRRALALPGAAVLLNVFLMAQVAAVGLCAFGASQPTGPDPGWLRALSIATRLFNSPVPSYALVFVLWTLLARPSTGIDVCRVAGLLARRPEAR